MRELVPDLQSMALVVIFTLGDSFIMALGSRAGNDIWLAFLLAIVLAVPVIALYARMRSLSCMESRYKKVWPRFMEVAFEGDRPGLQLLCLAIGQLCSY